MTEIGSKKKIDYDKANSENGARFAELYEGQQLLGET